VLTQAFNSISDPSVGELVQVYRGKKTWKKGVGKRIHKGKNNPIQGGVIISFSVEEEPRGEGLVGSWNRKASCNPTNLLITGENESMGEGTISGFLA